MSLQKGDIAPDFLVHDVFGNLQQPVTSTGQPTLLTFFRHAGCPPCNLRVHELINALPQLEQYNLRILAVFESTQEHIQKDLAHDQLPFPIIPDRKRALYDQYSVMPSFGKFISSFLWKPQYSIKAIFKHGYKPKFAEATTMMPADFLISPDGIIQIARYGNDLGDYLPLIELDNTLNGLGYSNNRFSKSA